MLQTKVYTYKLTSFVDVSTQDKDKQDLIRVIRKEISDESLYQQVWILKPSSEAEALDILAPTIKIPPTPKPPTEHADFLDIIGFKPCKIYSKFEQGYVDSRGKDVELLDILNKGADSCVYLGVHLYTLALLAVSWSNNINGSFIFFHSLYIDKINSCTCTYR